MPSEGMVSGGPPAPHMQNQMNGQMPGANHMAMQGPGPSQPPNMQGSAMSVPPSSHGSMGGYSHAVPSSQGMPTQGQMNMTQGQPMGSYGPRPNMNMQPNQGPMMLQQPPSQQYNMPPGGGQHYQGQQNPMAMMGQVSQGNHVMGQRPMPPYRPPQQGPPQQYPGQEDYYGEQYSHGGQGAPEGNSQYTQQQEAYQQGPPQQQGYPPQQQQYPGQQGYPGQQQGYESRDALVIPGEVIAAGPSQGAPGQYPNYPQGQGQQYAGYRPPQPGPPQAQQQRSYTYDQALMRK
ncbi:hypothetical protein AAFF_G00005970 [Aldrovandia affinis]|uniref:Uncharacterized protein n=1 Tax=Aldrovandia affinis TaxID=143900 RepID=A0AAD7X435_9TELE|nr:hypothetical protein AAFF_G00005970 [Aldrovandia affinis]